jgi:hypothetical protein
VWLEELAVPRVVGRVRGRQHMERITKRGDVERDRIPIGGAVKETDEIGGELFRTADGLADKSRVGDEV